MLLEINTITFNLRLNHLVNTLVKEYYNRQVAIVTASTLLKHQHQARDYPFLIKECRSVFLN